MYDRRPLRRLFGLTAASVRFLERAGYLRNSDDVGYAFRELIVLRTVAALKASKLPTRTIHQALAHLKPWLSEDWPMSRVSLESMADGIAVRDGTSFWQPSSGQYALPLEVSALESQIIPMKRKRTGTTRPIDIAHDHYLRGADLEEEDTLAARAAYEACLKGDCGHLEARINLGRLLHLEGKHREAELIYRDTRDKDATLFFNLGVLLEDQDKIPDAMAAYREAIVHDPGIADAHFNLALLLERAGETQAAFRHLLAYRRLSHIHESEAR